VLSGEVGNSMPLGKKRVSAFLLGGRRVERRRKGSLLDGSEEEEKWRDGN